MAFSPEKRRQVDAAARAILEETRASTLVALRFMGPALYAMPFISTPIRHGILATDGRRCAFDSISVIRAFRNDPNDVIRSYLHLVLHCVYRHPFDSTHPRRFWWDVACDIAVGAMVLELVGRRFPCKSDDEREEALLELKKHCSTITAERVFRAIALTKSGRSVADWALPPELLKRLEALFFRDFHGHWPRRHPKTDSAKSLKPRLSAVDFLPDDLAPDEDDMPPDDVGDEPLGYSFSTQDEHDADDGAETHGCFSADDAEAEGFGDWPDDNTSDIGFDPSLWDEIAKQVEAGLEDHRKKAGYEASAFTVSLSLANRKRFDYRQFLKRFASVSEEVMTNPDEFDYIYYNYGLSMYDNMPLVEPLEYQERSRVRDFVIAIDTSASCSGELVRRFVERTYNILNSAGGFGEDVNVHIVQCDDAIRSVLIVESIDDLNAYFANFKMSGLGNTDFRPVFEYVDNAIANQEFKNLKGIVYLTDGAGEYPSNRPRYDAVFIFVEANPAFITHVPPWAMKAVMDGDQIVEL